MGEFYPKFQNKFEEEALKKTRKMAKHTHGIEAMCLECAHMRSWCAKH